MAQMPDTAVSIGTSTRLYSRVLGEERTVLIALPRTHDAGSAKGGVRGEELLPRFPVLLLTDGDTHFAHAAAAASFLSDAGRIPELIVVAIPNNARLRDLSPPTDVPEDVADGTGGDAFLDFIVKELSPWLEANYRAAPLRILFGHSRGGLINIHALLTRPEAFRAHIAASPYFGWSRERMITRAGAELARVPGRHYFYMSAGDDEPGIRASVGKMAGVFRGKAPPGLEWHEEYLPGEDHGSTPYVTLYHGLRGFFANWNPTALIEAGDVAGVDAHYAALSREHGYAISPGAIVYYELGHALLDKARNETERQTRPSLEAAARIFERGVQAFPRNRYLYEGLGDALEASGRRREALAAMKNAYEAGRATLEPEEREALEQRIKELE